MIEKPLATTTKDAEDIIAAATQAGAKIMVAFENRWNPRFAMVRDILQAGDSGDVLNQVMNLNDTLFVPTRMLSWAANSSPAWFLMPHTLDLAMWLSSTYPVSVRATGVKKLLTGMGVDTWDCITATFKMNNGSYVVLNSSWILPETAPAVYDFRCEIQTTKATFHIESANEGVTQYGANRLSWPQWAGQERGDRVSGVSVDMINDFVDFVAGTNSTVPTHSDGLAVTKAIEAVHRSLQTGESVELLSNP